MRNFELHDGRKTGSIPDVSAASAASAFSSLFSERGLHAGFKQAVAGLLAFYWALLLQLPSPSWAVLTVMLLMIANYVGAIVEKSALRAAGTVVGAVIGVWLMGNYMNYPSIVLSGCFLALTFGVTMFGGTLFPYAFFLLAVTVAVVLADSLTTPELAWKVGLNRFLEICLGIGATLLVSSVLWPRFARDDFRGELCRAIKAAGRLVVGSGTAGSCDRHSEDARKRIQETFMQHLNTLHNLLHFGARESRYLATRAGSYEQLTLELSALFESAISIGRDKYFRDSYGPLIGAPLENLHSVLAEEFDLLSAASPGFPATNSRVSEAIEACDARMKELVEQKATQGIDFAEVLKFSVYYNAVLEISQRLGAIRAIIHGLPAPDTRMPRETLAPSWKPTQADLRNGIKTALSVVIGLVLVDWLQPPGGPAVPLAAFLFTCMPKLNPSGGGDVGSFRRALKVGLIGLALIPLLLVLVPFLSNPVWLGVYLAAGMFTFGIWSFYIGGMSGWSIIFLLFFCGVLGLNAQEPVGFQAIFGVVAGTTLGVCLASLVQRFIWPILPQVELGRTFANYYAMCAGLFTGGEPEGLKKTEALIAMFVVNTEEKIRAAHHILTPEDAARFTELAGLSQRLGFSLLRCRVHRDLAAPGKVGEFANSFVLECGEQFTRRLQILAEYFQGAQPYGEITSAMPAARELEKAVAAWRVEYLEQRISLTRQHLQLIATTEANATSAGLLDTLLEKAAELPYSRYSGDYYL